MANGELSTWSTSRLNIILLGGRNSGKSSLGNLILGKEEFVSRERTLCCRRLAVVAGRRLTVVDTPGWWCDFSAQDTSELVKTEIIGSVSLCPPGPHVFLIAVKASSTFSEKRRRAVEEHVALLGEKVWGRCMVVFIYTNRSEHMEEEELIKRRGTALRWLSEKCGHRCHSVVVSDDAGVSQLLEKIQMFVAENGNGVFEMEGNIWQENAEERRRAEERAQLRITRMRKHRSLMRGKLRPITDIRIVLLGAKGSGKTSTLNTILSLGGSQQPRRTARCRAGTGVVFGRQVTVVDTPGWWMNYFSDESPVFDRRETVLGLTLCPPGPQVFLLVIRVDRCFTETYGRAAREHLQLFSEHIWRRVMVLFTYGDWLGGASIERCIESGGGPLRRLLDRCGDRYHVLDNTSRGDAFQVRELIGKIEEMLSGCRGGQHYEIERTAMEQMEERMRGERERAEERRVRKERRRQLARSQLEKFKPLPEMRFVLVGGRKTGKSSCGNTILGGGCFHAEAQTASCSEKRAGISGKQVAVLDTPGSFCVSPDLLTASSALLLVVNVSSSFKDAHRVAVEKQLEAGGGQMWSRAVVLFSHGDWLGDTSIEQRIESEGRPLRRLVERCGNRYHVLDNKHRGDGAQVTELMELVEEMLVEERLAAFYRGDHMWKSVSFAGEKHLDAVTLRKRHMEVLRRHQMCCDLTESAASSARTSLSCSDDGGQMMALQEGRAAGWTELDFLDGGSFMSHVASMFSPKQRLRWTVNLPVWFQVEDLHLSMNGESQMCLFSSRHPQKLLALPQTQRRTPAEETGIGVDSLCHPVLRERTLRRLGESGGLQALIDRWDRWDHSSLEELEAFIDSYFEMVWEQTMGPSEPSEAERPTTDPTTEQQQAVLEEVEQVEQEDTLSSIDRKLSKLELLEEIRRDLSELRTSLEHSWTAKQEQREKTAQEDNNTC